MKTLTWLHLSDLHLCDAKTGWDAQRILDALVADLERMHRQHDLRPDMLLVSGDLAFGQLGEGALSIAAQFDEVALFLWEVREAFTPPLEETRVFLVPGNHDVVRGAVLDSQTQFLAGLTKGDYQQSSATVNKMLRDVNGEWRGFMQRLQAYREFLQEHFPHLLVDAERLCYAQQFEIEGKVIGIAGLNSAWSCGRDGEKGQLWLGAWQVRTLAQSLKDAAVKIAVAHHPLNWLVPQENPEIDRELARAFDFFVHGHEHQAWVEEPHEHVRVAAGACYGHSAAESGYNFVRLDLATGQGEVFLRQFDADGGGWVAKPVFERAEQGIWTIDCSWLVPKEPSVTPAMSQDLSSTATDSVSAPLAEEAAPLADAAALPASPEAMNPNSPEARGIFGRGAEIAELVKQLTTKPILLIHGIAGIGKTRLVREVCRQLPGSALSVSINVTAHTDADELFQYLAPSLGCHEQLPKPPRNLLKQIDSAGLKKYAQAEPCVVHVHNAHELFGESGFRDLEVRTLLRGLVAQLPHWRIVLESKKNVPDELLPKDICTVKRLRGLDVAAVQAYYQQPFGLEDSRGWALKAEAAELIHQRLGGKEQKTGAHPLGMVLLATVADGVGRTPQAIVQDYAEQFHKTFEERLFNDLYDNVLTAAQQHLLRLCCLYRRPIPDRHVEALVKRVKDDRAFRGVFDRFLLTPDEHQEKYTLHSLFAKLAEKRLLGGIDLQGDHAVIGQAWFQQVGTGQWHSLPRMIAANEAAYHFLLAEEFHRLQEMSHTLLGWDTPFKLAQWSERLYKRGDYENDRYVLELLVKLEPDEPKFQRFLGERIEQLEKRGADEALTLHLRAFELYPSFPPHLANLGRCYIARGEPAKFVELVKGLDKYNYEKAVDPHVHNLYSKCLEQSGQGEAASEYRRGLIQEGIREPSIYNDEADYLRKQRRYTEALEVLAKAEQVGMMNNHLWVVQASILQDSGQGAQASQLRQQKIAENINNPVFYNDEAVYLREQGDYAQALAVLEQAEQMRCTNEHSWAVKAKLLEALDRGKEASQLRRTRINTGSRNSALYNDEAVYLRAQRDYQAALAVLALAERHRCADEATSKIHRSLEKRLRSGNPDGQD